MSGEYRGDERKQTVRGRIVRFLSAVKTGGVEVLQDKPGRHLVYFCYAYATKITKVIPPSTAHSILRVIAFILLCIGVQIAWDGLAVLIAAVLRT